MIIIKVLNNRVYTFTNGVTVYNLECSNKTEAIDWFFETINRKDFKMLYISTKGELKEVDLMAARKRRMLK